MRNVSPSEPSPARGAIHWWLADRYTGRITLVQWPNPALVVFFVTALAIRLGLFSDRTVEIQWVGAGALIAWGADEIFRGVNPARRILGLAVLGWQVYKLLG